MDIEQLEALLEHIHFTLNDLSEKLHLAESNGYQPEDAEYKDILAEANSLLSQKFHIEKRLEQLYAVRDDIFEKIEGITAKQIKCTQE